jgi:hypothetical protein
VKEASGCGSCLPQLVRVAVHWREHALLRSAIERGDYGNADDVVDDVADDDVDASISR